MGGGEGLCLCGKDMEHGAFKKGLGWAGLGKSEALDSVGLLLLGFSLLGFYEMHFTDL